MLIAINLSRRGVASFHGDETGLAGRNDLTAAASPVGGPDRLCKCKRTPSLSGECCVCVSASNGRHESGGRWVGSPIPPPPPPSLLVVIVDGFSFGFFLYSRWAGSLSCSHLFVTLIDENTARLTGGRRCACPSFCASLFSCAPACSSLGAIAVVACPRAEN